ncbi:unnamed protein product [Rotaria socialis]|uniref:Uncharacterized protein n=1 Tax=Rotaria socialis TaxID=392032 RepID=A0A817R8U1_9BILA|nr:unnamed protein product [Rotaria socialis]
MAVPEQIIQMDGSAIETRDQKSVKFRGGLRFISSLLLPLTLGIFTIVITFQQQTAAKQQRNDDREAAQQQRDQASNLDSKRYQNDRFDAYIKEMGKLLKENHGEIISSKVAITLARVQTLNIFRQLDAQRNVHIIRFLYEAKQLTDTPENRSLDLSTAELSDIDFRESSINKKILNNLSLTDIFLSNATFIGITMAHVNFALTQFNTANFLLAEINNANFSSAAFNNTSFASTSLSNTIFAGATFKDANFSSTKFNYAVLSDCNFGHSNLKDAVFQAATLNQVNFSRANLYQTTFISANMAKSELNNALSIQDTVLPNGNHAHDENLITNGQADCNISHISSWTVSNGNISSVISNSSNSNCQFTLQSLSTGATMYQRVRLSDKWNSNLWTFSEAVLSAKMSTGVSIDLKGLHKNKSVSSKETLSSNEKQINLLLHNNMWELEVFIQFNATTNHSNMSNYWCDDIKLYIIYGTYFESMQVNIPANATWVQNGVTIAEGSKEEGNDTNQLRNPFGIFVDDDQTVVVADYENHRIMQWKNGNTTNGQVVAGGKSNETGLNQLQYPTDVLIDKETDSLIICDRGNQQVVRWSRRSGTTQGKILIDNIDCWGLVMDERRYLYLSDYVKHEVKRYQLDEKNGILVAGGNGEGDELNQLKFPTYLFVDRQQNVYVSDNENHRVMKWNKGAKEGIVVAGGEGLGNALTQLNSPNGLFVDTLGTLYVADTFNHRVMRLTQEAKQGTVVAGGNGEGTEANQFNVPIGLSFDRHGNLYVGDHWNNRVQRFSIK